VRNPDPFNPGWSAKSGWTANARAILAGDEYADEAHRRERFYLDAEIHAVPAVIINDRHLISGVQPVAVFEEGYA
jgi:predicted DsbA family dithiol-disulfide isomerase